ncbi:hypothetical protein DL93DRAFT_2084842 [Clavulina sp. PMI_390]|nr:hypothetical protein DL93DRAFT_2084842 [Clavulina sp. PMI_390]
MSLFSLSRTSTSAWARGVSSVYASPSSRAFSASATALKRAKPRRPPIPFDASTRPSAEWREPLNDQESALVGSTPMAVRERRAAEGIPDEKMASDGLTVVQRLAYERRRARGDFLNNPTWPNGEPSAQEWLEYTNNRRNRLRGRVATPLSAREKVKAAEDANADPDVPLPSTVEDIVGRPIYLPDLVLRLVPNYTKPNESYNSWEATFYTSAHGVTKTDVRSYLYSTYGLEVTYIRTDNRFAPIQKRQGLPTVRSNKGIALKSKKRIVVGLKEPFYFPNMREDMTTAEREAQAVTLDASVAMTAQIEERASQVRTARGMKAEPWGNRTMGKKNVMREKQGRRNSAEQNVTNKVHELIGAAVDAGTHGSSTVRADQIPLPERK